MSNVATTICGVINAKTGRARQWLVCVVQVTIDVISSVHPQRKTCETLLFPIRRLTLQSTRTCQQQWLWLWRRERERERERAKNTWERQLGVE